MRRIVIQRTNGRFCYLKKTEPCRLSVFFGVIFVLSLSTSRMRQSVRTSSRQYDGSSTSSSYLFVQSQNTTNGTDGGGFVGTCFRSLVDMNTAMNTELDRIRTGGIPESSYTYILCSDTIFDATITSLRPVLNNILFLCGDNGSRLNGCVILGSSSSSSSSSNTTNGGGSGGGQVIFVDSTVPGYVLNQITFMGITFAGFEKNENDTGTSIQAIASQPLVAKFIDVAWQEFDSNFVIRQVPVDTASTSTAVPPMTIEIDGASILEGTSGSIFDNDQGTLRVQNIQVRDVTAAAFIATANGGISFLDGATIEGSELDSVTFTSSGSTQNIANVVLTGMNFMEDAFYIENESVGNLLDVKIERNSAVTVPWSAVVVRSQSTVSVTDSTISENNMVEFGVIAFNSFVTVVDSRIDRNTGVDESGTTSAPIFAITDAVIQMERVQFSDNTGFSGEVVALIRSNVVINRSCFQNGNAEFVVFVANDSSYQQQENFLENFTSTRCPANVGPRLFLENDVSGCFLGSTTCEGDCVEMSNAATCRATEVATPTNAPIGAPVVATIAPITTETPISTTVPVVVTTPTIPPTTVSPTFVSNTTVPVVTPVTAAPVNGTTPVPVSVTTASPVSVAPSPQPSSEIPTKRPSKSPVVIPSQSPSSLPSTSPTFAPSKSFSPTMTPIPTTSPTISFSPSVSFEPSVQPTTIPTQIPSSTPSDEPSQVPVLVSDRPTVVSLQPSIELSSKGKKSSKAKKCKSIKTKKGRGRGRGRGKKFNLTNNGKGSSKSSGKGKGKGKDDNEASKIGDSSKNSLDCIDEEVDDVTDESKNNTKGKGKKQQQEGKGVIIPIKTYTINKVSKTMDEIQANTHVRDSQYSYKILK